MKRSPKLAISLFVLVVAAITAVWIHFDLKHEKAAAALAAEQQAKLSAGDTSEADAFVPGGTSVPVDRQSADNQGPAPYGWSAENDYTEAEMVDLMTRAATTYSMAEIAEDYLSGAFELTDYYTAQGGWVWIEATGKAFKPEAVLPYDDWDAEKVAKAAVDESIPWAQYGGGMKRLWSKDYKHEFTVYGHIKLYIDGDYACEVPHMTSKLEPLELIKAYQSGDWDGKTKVWSEDGSTYAVVLDRDEGSINNHLNGCLQYEFTNSLVDVPQANGSLWACDHPWWDDGIDYEFEREGMERSQDDLTGIVTRDAIIVKLYVDLPNGQLTDEDGYGKTMKVIPCGEFGTLVLTTKGGWLFKRGEGTAWPAVEGDD